MKYENLCAKMVHNSKIIRIFAAEGLREWAAPQHRASSLYSVCTVLARRI